MTIGLLLGLLLAGETGDTVASLRWMTGCWQGRLGRTVLQEQWNSPAGGMMMGMSRNLKDGRPVFSEFMRIETRGADVYFVARIGDSKQAPTPFKLIAHEAKKVVFENPDHDFPQRIIYRGDEDGLVGRIEGKHQGKERAEDYPLKRVSCSVP